MSSPPPSAGPMPGDMKRAEVFKLEKERTIGNGMASEMTETKRESLLFDAEKDKGAADKAVADKN